MTPNELAELRQFFGAYFHQDWMADACNPDQIIQQFIQDGRSSDELHQLARRIEKFSDSFINDTELANALFNVLGSYYVPSPPEVRDWLRRVVKLLRAE